MFRKLVPLIAAGYALYQWDQKRRERAQGQPLEKSAAKPQPVTTWEGEGGALRTPPATPSA
ncbi:MAG: hypothetical protein ABIQ29_05575 [Burkholderiaceae bacterium]